MKLEEQVISLDLARRLKELRVKKNSLFVYEYIDDNCYGIAYKPYAVVPAFSNNVKWYPAYNVSELGAMLPSSINDYWLRITNWSEHDLSYEDDAFHVLVEIQDKNEANARGKMLIHLLENGLLELK